MHSGENFYLHPSIPAVSSPIELYNELASPPNWQENETALPHHIRRRLVALRLSNYFLPGARQLRLYEEFICFVRDGYKGRGRTSADQERRIREVAQSHRDGTLINRDDHANVKMTSKNIGLNNTARSAVLIGTPGMGKTLTVEEILNRFPEVIEHNSPFHLKQVVWLKLDCPQKGSVKNLCVDFFSEMDRILDNENSSYKNLYAHVRATEESMMSHMALLANLHALGVLVVDEIQHLKKGDGNLLKFLVTLINKIGVPIMLIGTTEATEIVRETARLARRAMGSCSAIWERHSSVDDDWIKFVNELWGFQWTTEQTELTTELSERMYHHTQGVIDLAVKLFIFVQLRAIRIGEVSRRPERITIPLLDSVARDEMKIIQPLLDALRRGSVREIEKYQDLSSFTIYVTNALRKEIGDPKFIIPAAKGEQRGGSPLQLQVEGEADADDVFNSIFVQLGIGVDAGRLILRQAREENPAADFFALLDYVRNALKASPAKTKGRVRTGSAGPLPPEDLRSIVAAGHKTGLSAFRSLELAGFAGDVSYFRKGA